MKKQKRLSVYVWYHDETMLEKVTPKKKQYRNPTFHYYDLNRLPVLESLKPAEMTEDEYRLGLSEFGGLAQITPDTEMTGSFLYSIPLKFSAAYADATNNRRLFLPPVTFDLLAQKKYRKDTLYGVEWGDPCRDLCSKYILSIHNDPELRRGGEKISKKAPFKSSFIVNTEEFLNYQRWLKEVIRFLFDRYGTSYREVGMELATSFSRETRHIREDNTQISSILAARGLAHILERATAYFFGQTFRGERKIRLGPFLNRKSGFCFRPTAVRVVSGLIRGQRKLFGK
ncbi:MAG: hypothetical protein GF333_06645 [Candidatus Omnitrophica bacterium]|nr:hypothetical protein [Candidatus Omnitrophota bacterium]